MASRLKDCVARVLSPRGEVVGLAFRISEERLLTCAHVVAAACDLPLGTSTPPSVPVRLAFPAHAPDPFLARVIHWEPLRLARAVPAGAGDVAVLHVETPLPASISVAPLRLPDDLPPALYRALGRRVGADAAGELTWQYHEVTEEQPSGWRRSRPSRAEARHAPPLDFSGAPVWDPLARGVVGLMTTPGAHLGSRESFWLPWGPLARQWPELLAHLQPTNPYRGLSPFREEEQPVFFGREEATAALVERLRRSALLAIVGPEGSGKSSLLHAGVIPALRRDPAQRWLIGTFRATPQPLRALAEALIGLRSAPMSEQGQRRAVEVLEAALRERKLSLLDVVAQLQREAPHRPRVLLAADQLETLLALDPADPERQQMLELLLDSAQSDTLTLLLLLQAEGLEPALADVGLARALQGRTWFLPPLSRDELHRAVQAPAAARGVRVERGLIGQVVHEAAQQAHPLPAVSLLLRRLWEERSDATMWRSEFTALGGVAGAVARHAEQQYASLQEPERDPARRLFLRLFPPTVEGGWGCQSVPLASLPPDEGALVQRLARAQLLALRRLDATGETIVAPHAAVARGWPRLQGVARRGAPLFALARLAALRLESGAGSARGGRRCFSAVLHWKRR